MTRCPSLDWKVGDRFKVLTVDGSGCPREAVGQVFKCAELVPFKSSVWVMLRVGADYHLMRTKQVARVGGYERVEVTLVANSSAAVCVCPIVSLMQQGCSCGGK